MCMTIDYSLDRSEERATGIQATSGAPCLILVIGDPVRHLDDLVLFLQEKVSLEVVRLYRPQATFLLAGSTSYRSAVSLSGILAESGLEASPTRVTRQANRRKGTKRGPRHITIGVKGKLEAGEGGRLEAAVVALVRQ